MIKIKNEIRGHNFSGKEDGGIIYEVMPKDSPVKYRLYQKYSVDTGIRLKEAIKTEFVHLNTTGKLHLLPGMPSDGATGGPDLKRGMRSFFIHDALCGLIIQGLLPEKYLPVVNDLFKKTFLDDKAEKCVVSIYRFFLKLFSKKHIKRLITKQTEQQKEKKIQFESQESPPAN